MMHGLDAYLRGLDSQEAALGEKCWKAANESGLTETQAEECDDFEYRCAGCPWKEDWPDRRIAKQENEDEVSR